MVIYLDILIMLNFVINYCFMKLIYIVFNEKINKIRIILSSLISVCMLFAFFFNSLIFNIVKKYICEIQGHIQPTSGTIDLPIDREEAPSIKRFVSENGKQSVTHYKVLQSTSDTDFVEVTLQTGRTHQIRVHL